MLTKGHDFPNLSLVAFVNVDQGLFGSGYRSSERFAQQYYQASGRCGRRNKKGLVLLQTHNVENEALKSKINDVSAQSSELLAKVIIDKKSPFLRSIIVNRGSNPKII